MSASQLKRDEVLADNFRPKLLWPVLIILATIVADQLTKFWAVNYLSDKPSVEVFGRFFMLTLVYNKGGALGTSFGSSTYYLVSSLLILIIVFYYLVINWQNTTLAYPLSLIAGGAIGNIIDRIRLGMVIDFLDVDFFDIDFLGYHLDRWWTFNLADAAISCSIIFLLGSVLFSRFRPKTITIIGDQTHSTSCSDQ
ncbi:MAG: signal peptidase II [Candidatus Zixiibacteriota bacterium]